MYTPDSRGVLNLLLTTNLDIVETDSPSRFVIRAVDGKVQMEIHVEMTEDETDRSVIGIDLEVRNLATVELTEPHAAEIYHDLLEFNGSRAVGGVQVDSKTGVVGYAHSDALIPLGEDGESDLELLEALIACFTKNAARAKSRIEQVRDTGKTHHARRREELDREIEEVFARAWEQYEQSMTEESAEEDSERKK
jgi:hypothetical protein